MVDRIELLTSIYQAFNARKPDVVLACLAPDVRWPNGWEGGEIAGREAVSQYWTRQWATINPIVKPRRFESLGDDRIRVEVHQRVLDADGNLLVDQTVAHVFTFSGDVVAAMDIEDNEPKNPPVPQR